MELCQGAPLLLLRISIGNRDTIDGTMSVSLSDVAWDTNAMSVIVTPIQGDFFPIWIFCYCSSASWLPILPPSGGGEKGKEKSIHATLDGHYWPSLGPHGTSSWAFGDSNPCNSIWRGRNQLRCQRPVFRLKSLNLRHARLVSAELKSYPEFNTERLSWTTSDLWTPTASGPKEANIDGL